jgi:hypothetical protein
MSELRIDINTVRELAKEVTEGREEYIYIDPNGMKADTLYATCVNWDRVKDEPSCIVGHILFRAGVPKERLIADIGESAEVFEDYYAADGTEEYLLWLQDAQDHGKTWGESYLKAEADYAEEETAKR